MDGADCFEHIRPYARSKPRAMSIQELGPNSGAYSQWSVLATGMWLDATEN